MSALEVTDRFEGEIGNGYRFAILNFANPDMVGHTGVIQAVVRAVETVDSCLGRITAAIEALGGVCVITSDHGNAEQLLQPDGSPHTAHTTNAVPLIVTVDGGELSEGGALADLVPTCLSLLGISPPPQMSGRNLLSPR
jgi:2,3-bisphosphoglycerate-independent phosphoglycerate mutase